MCTGRRARCTAAPTPRGSGHSHGYHRLLVSGEVRLEQAGPIGWVVFDHLERRNALTARMMAQVVETMERADADSTIRVVVLRGAGERAFVSGADISAFGSESGVESGPRAEDVIAAITGLAKPVIAALRGWCLGAGVLMALSADLRIAGDDLRIGIPAAKLGVAYPRPGVDRVVTVAGPPSRRRCCSPVSHSMPPPRCGPAWLTGSYRRHWSSRKPAGRRGGRRQRSPHSVGVQADHRLSARPLGHRSSGRRGSAPFLPATGVRTFRKAGGPSPRSANPIFRADDGPPGRSPGGGQHRRPVRSHLLPPARRSRGRRDSGRAAASRASVAPTR